MNARKAHNRRFRATIRHRRKNGSYQFTEHTFTFDFHSHNTPLAQAWAYAKERYGNRVKRVTVFKLGVSTTPGGIHVNSMEAWMTQAEKLQKAIHWCERAIDESDPVIAKLFRENAICSIRDAETGDTPDNGLLERDGGLG